MNAVDVSGTAAMFPRKSAVTRILTVIFLISMSAWLFISISYSVHDHNGIQNEIHKRSILETREYTVKNGTLLVTAPKRTHHHDNNTLQKLVKNMTIFKVN